MNVAAIDLGTNSIKILIVKKAGDGQMHVLFRHRAVVRLGEGTFNKTGKEPKLSKLVQNRTLKVLRDYARFLEVYHVDVVRATGTSALREAKNGLEFIKEVRNKTGIALEVLPAVEEARLIVKGVSSEFNPPKNQAVLFIDIGGGSCELSAVKRGRVEKFVSLPLGAVRLTELYLPNPKAKAPALKQLDAYILKILKNNWPNPEGFKLSLGSAGTIRALCRAISKTELTEDANLITVNQLERMVKKMAKMTRKQLAALPGIDANRAEILKAGTRVLWQIFKYFKIREMRVSQRGLREGLVLELLESPQKAPTEKNDLESRRKEILLSLSRRYHSHQTHCLHVWYLASELFDQLAPVHGMGQKYKSYLMVAALLHDVGKFVSEEGYHKHSYYIIKNSLIGFLSPKEIHFAAVLARYHRKSPPKAEHEGFRELSLEEKKQLTQLAAILRMATGLDEFQDQSVKWLRCQWTLGHVRIGVALKEGTHLNSTLLKEKVKLFEDLYKVEVRIIRVEMLHSTKTKAQMASAQ